METSHKVSIAVGILGLIGTIVAAIIGVVWGKSNVSIVVQSDGKNIEINNDNAQEIIYENKSLKQKLEELQNENNSLNEENELLHKKEEKLRDEVSAVSYQDLGLSIDGEEKNITKEKSSVSINGKQYYSKEFIDNLLPDDKYTAIEDDIFYIGKIVKEKIGLFELPVIEESYHCYFEDSIKDTYGNSYGKSMYFKYNNYFATFNTGRNYSYFKCTIAMKEKCKGNGVLQIIADNNIIYTSSEIINTTEPFEIDIPINQASIISISTVGENDSHIFISNAVLYNQE